jgi:hypothetical protein
MLAGGLLLVWIAYKLLAGHDNGGGHRGGAGPRLLGRDAHHRRRRRR